MRDMLVNNRNYKVRQGIDRSGYTIGGKSGTAQVVVDGEYDNSMSNLIGSYIGFVGPSGEMPQYIIMTKMWGEGAALSGGEAGDLFDDISNFVIDYLKIKPDILINRLGYLYDNIETILTPSDISSIPIAFFKDIKDIDNSLTIYCKSVAIEYLNSITLTEWKQAITSQNSKYKLLIILEPKIQNCFDAFKEITTAHAKGEYPSLTKKTYESIINLAIKNHRSLVPVFNTLRDLFCGGQVTMTPELFEFYGDLLFQYSDLQNNNSSLRTIFNAAILNKPQNINLIIKNQEKMVQVINKAEKEDRKDFRDKIQSLLNNEYKNDESFETFVKIINIEEPSIHEPNNTIK